MRIKSSETTGAGVLGLLIVGILLFFANSFIVMFLWNALAESMSASIPQISFLQAIGLKLLFSFLNTGYDSSSKT